MTTSAPAIHNFLYYLIFMTTSLTLKYPLKFDLFSNLCIMAHLCQIELQIYLWSISSTYQPLSTLSTHLPLSISSLSLIDYMGNSQICGYLHFLRSSPEFSITPWKFHVRSPYL